MTLIQCEDCKDGKLENGKQCPVCEGTCEVECEHDDVCQDEGCCLICGEDMREELSAMAYDRAKDRD